MKKLIALLLAVVLIFPTAAYGLTDDYILGDNVKNIYAGRQEASVIIENLKYTDVPAGHWAREPIMRAGALNLMKGSGITFRPEGSLSNQEALSAVLRIAAQEQIAAETAATLVANAPQGSNLSSMWSLGYLNVAMQNGLITQAEYNSALQEGTTANSGALFSKFAAASRERVAEWLVLAMRINNPEALILTTTIQRLLTFPDYNEVTSGRDIYLEALLINGVLNGKATLDGTFLDPLGLMTRAEMAQMFRNTDEILYNNMGMHKKTGTVGAIRDSQTSATGKADLTRNLFVRSTDGTMEVIQYEVQTDSGPYYIKDVVVYKNGDVGGIGLIAEGDEIEYIVNDTTKETIYVQVIKSIEYKSVQGQLNNIDTTAKTVTILDSTEKRFTYPLADGMITSRDNIFYINIDGKEQAVSGLPMGSTFRLNLANNIVRSMNYIGEPPSYDEIRGIVIENNVDFGYITIWDNNGMAVTKYFYEDELKVQKKEYYNDNDNMGYISEIFPNFDYNPLDSTISAIEPGDIVFIRPSQSNPMNIERISAAVEYVMKYGKIRQITHDNTTDMYAVLVEYEDKQTSWFDVSPDIFVTKDGKYINASDILAGDWARFLINQAIIAPGHVMESVKEITIEGDEHFISNIVKGNFSGINSVQKLIMLENAYTMTKMGWTNYKQMQNFNIENKDIEYYQDGKRISQDAALKLFNRSDAMVYVALENYFAGERVKKVTFRTQREEILQNDTVYNANGQNSFNVLNQVGDIKFDSGTIVRRHGRLVDGLNIMPSDFAYVVLNGEGNAAIVDITDMPDNSRVSVARGRILSVNEGQSFKVASMSVLSGNEWVYTPIEREFVIDHNTKFINENGLVDRSLFIGFTENTVVDKVYNIIYNGTKATHIIESPYSTRSVKGTVYKIEGDVAFLRDAVYYDNTTGKWISVSYTDPTLTINIANNTMLAKNNAIIGPNGLQVGDYLRVFTNTLPDKIQSGIEVDAYIGFVDK